MRSGGPATSIMLTDPAAFEELARGLGEAMAGLVDFVVTGADVVAPAAQPETSRAARTAAAAFTLGSRTDDALESSCQPLTVTVALPWRSSGPGMPTNCQRRSYGPGWVPEGTGICMANRTDWPGAMLPAGRQLRMCGSLAKTRVLSDAHSR